MQARTKKLAPVVKHIDKNEQQALQAVAYSQQQLKKQQDSLAQLMDYKSDYMQRHQSGLVTCGAVQFKEFRRFLDQLDETIERQQLRVASAERELDFKRQKWKLKRSRSEAMHKVVDRLQTSEELQIQKSEQKMMDEIALRSRNKKT